jgi:heme oxygenase
MNTLDGATGFSSTNAATTRHPAAPEPDPPPDHSIMSRLRHATQALHDQAEASPFQKALIAGELPIESYVALLEQLYHVHDALERELDALRRTSPIAAAVLRDEHFQTPYLREDLLHFEREPGASEPHAAVRRPIALLGAQYVLEGSNNGSKFIARRLMSAYALRTGPGLRYMDPYGDSQRAVWAAFKEAMNVQPIADADAIAMIGMARWTFVGIMSLGEELVAGRLIKGR